jgi:hypothetical protein
MLCSASKSTPRLLPKKQEQVFPNKAGSHFPTGCKKCDVIFFWTTERLKHSPQSRARSEPPNTHNSPFPLPKATRQISGSYTPTAAPSHATQSSTQQTPTAPPKPHTCNRFVPPRAISGSHALRNPYGVLLQDGAVLSINPPLLVRRQRHLRRLEPRTKETR